jgi:hypothetical protein
MIQQSHFSRTGGRFPSVALRKVLEYLGSLISKSAGARKGEEVICIQVNRGQAAPALAISERTVRAVLVALENVGVIERIKRGTFVVAYLADGQIFTPFNIVKDMLLCISTLAGGTSTRQARDLMAQLRITLRLFESGLCAAFKQRVEYLSRLACLITPAVERLACLFPRLSAGERDHLAELAEGLRLQAGRVVHLLQLQAGQLKPEVIRQTFNRQSAQVLVNNATSAESCRFSIRGHGVQPVELKHGSSESCRSDDFLLLISLLSLKEQLLLSNKYIGSKDPGESATYSVSGSPSNDLRRDTESHKSASFAASAFPGNRVQKARAPELKTIASVSQAKTKFHDVPPTIGDELQRLLNCWCNSFLHIYGFSKGYLDADSCPRYVRDAISTAGQLIGKRAWLVPREVFTVLIARQRLFHPNRVLSMKWLGTPKFLLEVDVITKVLSRAAAVRRQVLAEYPSMGPDWLEVWFNAARSNAKRAGLGDPLDIGGPHLRDFHEACLLVAYDICGDVAAEFEEQTNCHFYFSDYLWPNFSYLARFPFVDMTWVCGRKAAARALWYAGHKDNRAFVDVESEASCNSSACPEELESLHREERHRRELDASPEGYA